MSALATFALAVALTAAGPGDRATLDSLADATARDIGRFADKRIAIAEGYRRVGTDFPGMGEHWIHPAALLSGALDSRRPTMLSYATIAGRPTLLGAGFLVTTTGDAAADVPGWPAHWHEHSGLLTDESGVNTSVHAPGAQTTHVWVLNIWTALPNPSGRYDADNWTLPFARAGLVAPTTVDHDAARAGSLTVGAGDDYLRSMLTLSGLRTAATERAVDSTISDATVAAAALLDGARASGAVSPSDVDALRAVWTTLRERLRATLGAAVEPLLTPPPAHRHAHDQALAAPPPTRRSGTAPPNR